MFIFINSLAVLVGLVFQHVEVSLYGGSSFCCIWLSSSFLWSTNLLKVYSILSPRLSIKNIIGLSICLSATNYCFWLETRRFRSSCLLTLDEWSKYDPVQRRTFLTGHQTVWELLTKNKSLSVGRTLIWSLSSVWNIFWSYSSWEMQDHDADLHSCFFCTV